MPDDRFAGTQISGGSPQQNAGAQWGQHQHNAQHGASAAVSGGQQVQQGTAASWSQAQQGAGAQQWGQSPPYATQSHATQSYTEVAGGAPLQGAAVLGRPPQQNAGAQWGQHQQGAGIAPGVQNQQNPTTSHIQAQPGAVAASAVPANGAQQGVPLPGGEPVQQGVIVPGVQVRQIPQDPNAQFQQDIASFAAVSSAGQVQPGVIASGDPAQQGIDIPDGQALQKSFLTTWLLSLFLGSYGADRFYLGKTGTAIGKLLTLGGLGVWTLYDLFMLLTGKTTDNEGQPLEGFEDKKETAWIVSAAWVAAVTVLVFSSIVSIVLITGAVNSAANRTDDVVPTTESSAIIEEFDPLAAFLSDDLELEDAAEEEEDVADDEPEVTMTATQEQAVRAAEGYLRVSPFSRQGLIDQLVVGEGFSLEDAAFVADNMDISWNEQAARAAGNYMELMEFSRTDLIDQLVTADGFTTEQAAFGADSAGL